MLRDERGDEARPANPLQQVGQAGARKSTPERKRPPWAVAALVWATFGIYFLVWAGQNWSEIKRERNDDRMNPILHAVSLVVPIYQFFRIHAAFRAIDELLETTRSKVRTNPAIVTVTFAFAVALMFVPVQQPRLIMINFMAVMAATSWIAYNGQSSMNAYWEARRERNVTTNVNILERMIIGFGTGLWFLIVMSLIVNPEMQDLN